MMINYKVFIFLFLALLSLGIVGNADNQEALRHQSDYCEMTKLYKDTGGDLGWPDYDPNINCKGDQS
jgi:hypothetical protein|tara:strand:- start:347 stop:547 length:201 start_codon:yes stop_codon:yes gene_type:complete